jgi:hypothetical protein
MATALLAGKAGGVRKSTLFDPLFTIDAAL